MKPFFTPVLLACLLSLFVFGDVAMAQRRGYVPNPGAPGRNDRISVPPAPKPSPAPTPSPSPAPTLPIIPQTTNKGVRISKIYPNTTASTLTHSVGKNIRLESGDRLTSINGIPIRSDADFKRIVADLPRNSHVSVEVIDRRTSLREVFYGRMDVNSSLRFGLALTER